jgi:hypothetical protein
VAKVNDNYNGRARKNRMRIDLENVVHSIRKKLIPCIITRKLMSGINPFNLGENTLRRF